MIRFLGTAPTKTHHQVAPTKSRLWFVSRLGGQQIITYFFGVYLVVCFCWNCTQRTNRNLLLLVSPWMPRCVPWQTKSVQRDCFACTQSSQHVCRAEGAERQSPSYLSRKKSLGSNRPCPAYHLMRIVCMCVMLWESSFDQNSYPGREEMERRRQA